ncbi:MAG TPA: ATP-binding cassette domain-containing protein [Pseudonocardiaceae bacterium]|nr:ATP-binding cassette domain-containing protein [Pseudonocardiaceae bacterium]
MITARGLARTFSLPGNKRRFRSPARKVDAVRGVDLDVADGELVGFLGPNGAGKTTTLRMLATLLRPTAGEATVAGRDLRTDPAGVRRRIGYVGQGNSAGLDQRVREELVLQGRFHGLTPAVAARRADDLLDRFDLTETAHRVAATLSGGQKRRLDLALGLVHQPALVFLDEPSTGLDPHSRAGLWEHVRELRAEHGSTVFLTTHYLDEADALCDNLLVIDAGRIVAKGSPEELKQRVSGDLVVLTASDPVKTAESAANLPGCTELSREAEEVRFRVPRGDTALPALLRELGAASIQVDSVRTHRPTLDDVFRTVTGRSLQEV